GNPKGVLYSHRSNMVHGLIAGMKDAIGFGAADAILPVVPMFHANAWGIAFGAPMAGCKMVFPGMQMDGASIHELLETEQCTHAAAVPTVWLMLLQHLQSTGAKISTLKEVLIGGSAVPEKIVRTFLEDYGVETIHAWGMTEMSPIGTIAQPLPGFEEMSKEDQMAFRLKQGRTPWGVEMKIVDEAGKTLPRDGKTPGRLLVRGPAVVHRYFRQEDMDILDDEGYFDTGDMATIDRQGIMQITDRSKDVIKSGGEWISSIELENAAVTHPDVAEAAVIGLYHPKWDERPLLILVASGDTRPSKDDMVAFLSDKVAKWWLPDDVVYVDEIPHTATGKISKKDLRDQFKDYSLPTAV
ncbi:MAG: AMP-binding protein, partial [Pseudomonadota bacterium]